MLVDGDAKVSWYPADEYPVYQVRDWHGNVFDAVADDSGKPAPPIGRICHLVGSDELDCGRRWAHLRIWWPIPV